MIESARRRRLSRVLCAVLALSPMAACSTAGSNDNHTTFVTPQAAPPTKPKAAPSPTPAKPAIPGTPVGWKLSDVPSFGPPPKPEPVTLPTDDEAPYIARVPVKQKVAFLTIDDGYNQLAEVPKLMAAAHIPVTLFLTIEAVENNPSYFDKLRQYGAVIEAHTISHPELKGKGEDYDHHEICDGADQLGKWYGRHPQLFRPPFGDIDDDALRTVKRCGMKAAFFWKETVDKGIVRYQEDHLQPGDIILMHFRPAFVDDFLAALHAIKEAGLTPARLEDYIPGAAVGLARVTP